MGHEQVFAHVGRNVRIQAPNGRSVPILVTGTFGGSDFVSAFRKGLEMTRQHTAFSTDPLLDG